MINEEEKNQDSNREKRSYIWLTKDVVGTEVALAEDTVTNHVYGDHVPDKTRELSYPYVKKTIEKPTYILKDQNHEENGRLRYINHILIEEVGYIQNLVVVVDTDRTPNEITTWMVKSNTKQEKINGGVIYDSNSDTT